MKRAKTLPRALALLMSAVLLFSLVVGVLPTLAATGTTYYVAADGTGDGSSAANPMSFAQANATTLNGGDKLLFKRGDTFYGGLSPLVSDTSDESRVEIGAYGSGALPIISGAKIVSSAWTDNGDGFYKFDLTADGNYVGVKDDNVNVGFFTDAKGNYYGNRRASKEKCTAQYDFYCDDAAIYVMSDEDPYTALGTLKMAVHELGLKLNKGLNIHDLHIEYFGNGMDWGANEASEIGKYVRIYDCIIDNIGGIVGSTGVDEGGNPTITRVGNAISLWDAGEDIVIENNILRNTYDVGFTTQGNNSGDNVNYWKDIIVRDNIFSNCTQGIEVHGGATSFGSGMENMQIVGNLFINNGEGWGSALRETQDCDILTYGFTADIWQMTIEDNTFYHSDMGSSVYNLSPTSMEKLLWGVTMDNNRAFLPSEEYNYHFNRPADVAGGPEKYADLKLNFAEWQEFSGKDKNSSVTYIGDNLADYTAMEMVARTSLDYDEIARIFAAAVAEPFGTNVLVKNGNATVSAKTIAHTLDWQVAYPDYSGQSLANYTDAGASSALFDGNVETSNTLRNDSLSHPFTKRYALLFDLGARYDLSKVSLTVDPASVTNSMYDCRYVYNYSVYAGNTADSTLLSNCVGVGGGTDAVEVAKLAGASNVRYVLVVFDHMATDPGNANDTAENQSSTNGPGPIGITYTNGQIRLTEIEVYGEASTVPDPINVFENNTAVTVTEMRVNHTLDWSEDYPAYAADALTANVPSAVKLTAESLKLLTNGNTTDVCIPRNGESYGTSTAPALTSRVALLFDMGAKYDLSTFNMFVTTDSGRGVHNFSVYAGNTADGSLFSNCIGQAGTLGTTEYSVALTNAAAMRYVLVVFDHVGADPGNTSDTSRTTAGYPGTLNMSSAKGGCTLADGQIRINEIKLYGVKVGEIQDDEGGGEEEDPTADHKNILEKNTSASVAAKTIAHTLSWKEYFGNANYTGDPDYRGQELVAYTDANATSALYDGDTSVEMILRDGIGADHTDLLNKRYALLFDLGAQYDLSKVNMRVGTSNGAIGAKRYVYNYSVYAGNYADGQLLYNFVGRGGGTDDTLPAELADVANVRYVLIVFDHVGADPGVSNGSSPTLADGPGPVGCTYSSGQFRLTEIEVYGEASTGSAPSNVLADNTNLTVEAKNIAHTLDWREYFGSTNFTNHPDYRGEDLIALTDANLPTDGGVLTDGLTTEAKAFNYVISDWYNERYALLFDLGGSYDLSRISLNINTNAQRYVHNYSVYAGNSPDGLLLYNCVGRGGGTDAIETAYLTDVTNVRYALIVFDHVGTDPGNANDAANQAATNGPGPVGCTNITGDIRLYEIELYGTASTGKAVSNVLANNLDVKATAKYIEHMLDWTVAYPDYSGKVLNTYVDEAVTSVLYDGVTDVNAYKVVNGGLTGSYALAEGEEQAMLSKRYALLFDLGGQYDLSHIALDIVHATTSIRRYVYNYSVYAGNTPDGRLLSNCVGQGGGTTARESALLENATNVRYLLIVFDHVGSDPGNANDYNIDEAAGNVHDHRDPNGLPGSTVANGEIRLSEIELFGVARGNIRQLTLADGLTADDVKLSLGSNNLVTVDVVKADMWLKAGSLTYTVNGVTYPIVNRCGAYVDGDFDTDSETNSSSFFFSMPESGRVIVSAEFVDEGAANTAVLSTQISADYKMRFRSRVYRAYTVGDVAYELKEAGTLMVNKASNAVNTSIADDAVLSDTELEALYNGADGVRKVKAENGLVDRCDDYLDYVCAINFGSASSSYLDTEYCAITYAVYTDGANDVIVYSAAAVNSYNGVIAALAAL